MGEWRGHLGINRVHEIVEVECGYDWEIDRTGGMSERMVGELVKGWERKGPKTLGLQRIL